VKDDGTFELGEKLSEDDHAHLRARWDVTGLQRNAQNLGVSPEVAINAQFWTYDEYESALESAKDQEPAEQPQNPEAAPGGTADPVGGSIGDRQVAGLTEPVPVAPGSATPLGSQGVEGVPGDFTSPRSFADPELAGKQYEDWTKDQLIAEINKRNADRVGDDDYADDEPMVVTGNKADLVARLTEDDEADAPVEGESE